MPDNVVLFCCLKKQPLSLFPELGNAVQKLAHDLYQEFFRILLPKTHPFLREKQCF